MVALDNNIRQYPATVPYEQYAQLEQEVKALRRQRQFVRDLVKVPHEVLSDADIVAALILNMELEDNQPITMHGHENFHHICISKMATRYRKAEKTLGNSVARLETIGVLQKEHIHHHLGRTAKKETKFSNDMYVRPLPTYEFPYLYEDHDAPPKKKHGGYKRHCPNCGSINRDVYRVYVCHNCHTPTWEQVEVAEPEILENQLVEGTRLLKQDGTLSLIHQAQSESDTTEIVDSTLATGEDSAFRQVETMPISEHSSNLTGYPLLPLLPGQVETMPKEIPVTPPQPLTIAATDLAMGWLKKRRGSNAAMIVATGSLNSNDKYKKLYGEPDLAGYLAGNLDHIYGSHPGFAEDEGTSWLLCFDFDTAEQDQEARACLESLYRAGTRPVYWQRGAADRQRGHLELYFDRRVNAEQARAWCVEMCPMLGSVPECYPAKSSKDCRHNPVSWPLYQRVGDEVIACTPLLPQSVDQLATLDQVIAWAITPASLIDAFVLSGEQGGAKKQPGGGLLEKKASVRSGEQDIVKQVITEFNQSHSWDEIATLCGGYTGKKFCAVWRGDKVPSVEPLRYSGQEDYAIDYGNHGRYKKRFDKYQAWCYIRHIDMTADIDERCRAYRIGQRVQSPPCAASVQGEEWFL